LFLSSIASGLFYAAFYFQQDKLKAADHLRPAANSSCWKGSEATDYSNRVGAKPLGA